MATDCKENNKHLIKVLKVIDCEKQKLLTQISSASNSDINNQKNNIYQTIMESQLLMCERIKQTIINSWD